MELLNDWGDRNLALGRRAEALQQVQPKVLDLLALHVGPLAVVGDRVVITPPPPRTQASNALASAAENSWWAGATSPLFDTSLVAACSTTTI